ncbi:MAG: hypothetical protein OXF06_14610 [Bacteroidetes bacterium]|nr:hypothetical protein [Bacteroidota bacterium]MCY4226049.1 hypothetical protein [Bacteroidota bacterium]
MAVCKNNDFLSPTGDLSQTQYFQGQSAIVERFDFIISAMVMACEATIHLI